MKKKKRWLELLSVHICGNLMARKRQHPILAALNRKKCSKKKKRAKLTFAPALDAEITALTKKIRITRAGLHIRTHAPVRRRMHTHTNTQTHKHTQTQTHTNTHKHTQTHTHIHTYTHTHIHTYTHKYLGKVIGRWRARGSVCAFKRHNQEGCRLFNYESQYTYYTSLECCAPPT